MKRFHTIFLLIFMLIGIYFLTGCSKINFDTFTATEEETKATATIIPESSQDDTDLNKKSAEVTEGAQASTEVTNTTGTESATPTPEAVLPTANIELPVYTVDAELGDIKSVTALIPEGSEITPQLILDTVIESLADQSITIGVKDITTKEDAVIVNFDKNKAPYVDMGSGYEAGILDAIAQSLIDNLSAYNKIIYRVDDGAYISGVFELGIDEVYFER